MKSRKYMLAGAALCLAFSVISRPVLSPALATSAQIETDQDNEPERAALPSVFASLVYFPSSRVDNPIPFRVVMAVWDDGLVVARVGDAYRYGVLSPERMDLFKASIEAAGVNIPKGNFMPPSSDFYTLRIARGGRSVETCWNLRAEHYPCRASNLHAELECRGRTVASRAGHG